MSASSLGAAVHRIVEIQSRLPGPAAVMMGIVAILAAVLPDVWLVTRHITVMAHEGAHATMGSALGRRVTAVTFRKNAEGLTKVTEGSLAGNFVVTLVGYLGPTGFGIGAAELIRIGHIVAVLWACLVALLLLMVPLRASFGIVSVIFTFVLLLVVAGFASVGAQVLTAYAIAWFLLVSGVRIIHVRRKGSGDSHMLRGMTKVPHSFWYGVWLLGSLAGLGFGAHLLM